MDRHRSRRLEFVYLALTLVNSVVVVGYSVWQSAITGNILFWTDPARTMAEIFANGTSTAFGLDLAGVVLTAFVWMWQEARRLQIPAVWRFWILTLLFGLAAPLPFFLYVRERRLRVA
jgi:Terpene cyclase DEP1